MVKKKKNKNLFPIGRRSGRILLFVSKHLVKILMAAEQIL